HRHAGRLVAEAERLEIDQLALAGDRHHGARDAALLDVAVDDFRDLAEPLGRHAGGFGLGARQRLAADARGRIRHRVYLVRHGLSIDWKTEHGGGNCRRDRADDHHRLPAASYGSAPAWGAYTISGCKEYLSAGGGQIGH